MLASKAGKWLLNRPRLPTHSNLALSSPDGDRPPPLELFTRGWYSWKRIREELTAFSLPGTVILVHRKQGGSKLAVHGRWLVVRSMLGDQMIAFDPWTGRTLKVNACRPLPMVDGDNFDDYCGTNWLVRKMRSTGAMPLGHMDKITCQLPQLDLMKRHVLKLPTVKDMIKRMKEGELLELMSKDVLVGDDSEPEEGDEEEPARKAVSKEFTLRETSGDSKGDNTTSVEVAPRHSTVGHSVEDEKVLATDMSTYDSELPTSNEVGRVTEPRSIGEVPVGPLGENRDTTALPRGVRPIYDP